MSDIPIGSPPAPPGRHAAPQGWYPDPVDRTQERWWDGWSWSRNTRPAEGSQPRTAEPGGWQGQQSGYRQAPGSQDQWQQSRLQQGQGQQIQWQPAQPVQGDPYARVTGPRTEDGVPLASWGWRFLAGLVDLIIVTVVGGILSIPVVLRAMPVISDYFQQVLAAAETGRQPPVLTPQALFSPTDQILISLISVAVGFAYFTLFWRFRSATPGQLLCALRVVPFGKGRSSERLAWGPCIVRGLIWGVPVTAGNYLLLFAVLNALFPLWNANRQAVHDIAAKTQVVKIK